ncbi:hypothetical protein DSO57_1000349 [Entomophthora muscae]|uniref:Uncharacterized protein n=1 Tax=Entomophthora muscae TaxID=34485 RepID=A0ACC2TKF0_9FUNG|nr:hypothetical protein DSO57_1000349 [Entomophthora muscae]
MSFASNDGKTYFKMMGLLFGQRIGLDRIHTPAKRIEILVQLIIFAIFLARTKHPELAIGVTDASKVGHNGAR